jgi:bifunctional DNase/RNase
MISVRVHGVGMSPYNQGFVALLMDDVNNEWLPIYIGSFEAQAIAMELDDVDPPRPMTHDLMAKIIDKMDVQVEKIVVNELKDSTYYAEITLTSQDEEDDEEVVIDARPSDSIALALRTEADIFVAEDVMEEASVPANPDEEESEQNKKLKILQHRLQRAVEEENFEEAADLRDQIREVQREIREEAESEEIEEELEEQLAEELGREEEEEEAKEVGYTDFDEFEEKLENFEEDTDVSDDPSEPDESETEEEEDDDNKNTEDD